MQINTTNDTIQNPLKKQELNQYNPGLYQGRASTSKIIPERDIEAEIASNSEKKKLYDTALEFQSLFINMMLKSMRANLDKKNDMLHAGMKQDIFEDMLYDEYAKEMSKDKRFELAKMIFTQLSDGLGDPQKNQEAIRNYESNLKTPFPNISGEQLIDKRF
ncbi:MAG: rod-binding protein [Spirochaetia bacterium]|nr:rod-binding protein [Spirochaetia bacterium]